MGDKATILAVDDVPANLSLLFDSLSAAGYRVLVAESGEGALAQVEHEVPDLVLLDFLLPGMNGLEVCRRLRRRPEFAEIPIIFLTAIQETDDKVRALESGAVDYVTKPIQTAEVLARVRTHLRLAYLHRELTEELAMRREAEELLRDSLDRGLIVASGDGEIRFATRLAQTLLARHFPEGHQRRLPVALQGCLKKANGEIPKEHGLPFQVEVLRSAVREGEVAVLELADRVSPGPSGLLGWGLTPREAEVLFWMSEGKSNPEIALILSSSRRTVEKHVEHVLEKLDVENRAMAARLAIDRLRDARG